MSNILSFGEKRAAPKKGRGPSRREEEGEEARHLPKNAKDASNNISRICARARTEKFTESSPNVIYCTFWEVFLVPELRGDNIIL